MEYLLFRLYGPLASWGDIAVGELRHSFSSPTKSAVMGLVAAALGIKREEENTHLELNQCYQIATAVWSPGQLLRDYHTIQAPGSANTFNHRTRLDQLKPTDKRPKFLISNREYRTDALAWVALSCSNSAPFSLEDIAQALEEPVFTLYLGRKSCPLAAPLDPTIIAAPCLEEAFTQYRPRGFNVAGEGEPDAMQRYLSMGYDVEYFWEGSLESFSKADSFDLARVMTLTRHDQVTSRTRWQFAPRQIHRYHGKGES